MTRIIFRKARGVSDVKTWDVIAFFPDTLYNGDCNPGCLMSYAHLGQHSEATVDFYHACKPCSKEEYADLLYELEHCVGYDDLKVVKRLTREKGETWERR